MKAGARQDASRPAGFDRQPPVRDFRETPDLRTGQVKGIVRFSTIGKWFVLVLVISTTLNWFRAGESGLPTDGWTYLATYAFFGILLIIFQIAARLNYGLLALLGFAAALAYGQSGVLLMWGESEFGLARIGYPTAANFTTAFWVATWVTAWLAAGLIAARLLRRKHLRTVAAPPQDTDHFFAGRRILIALAIVGMIVASLLTASHNIGASAVQAEQFAWLARLFDRNLILMIATVLWVMYGDRLRFGERISIAVIPALHLAVSLFQGSRGSLVVIVATWAAVRVVRDGDFRVSTRAITVGLLAIVGTGLILFPLGSSIRSDRVHSRDLGLSAAIQELSFGDGLGPLEIAAPILRRQGRMDQLIVISNRWRPEIRERFQVAHIADNLVASLVPGWSAAPNTSLSRVWVVQFRDFPADLQHGEGWTPAALVWFLQPSVTGSAALAVVGSLLIGAAYRAVLGLRSGYALFIGSAVSYVVGVGLFTSASVDNTSASLIRSAVILTVLGQLLKIVLRASSASKEGTVSPAPQHQSRGGTR